MKWFSVLFSRLSGKLGDQIVGTSWKGRGVFRKYVIPANPKTCLQRQNRAHQKILLELYQANVGGDETKKGYWNADALPRRISGYNLFMKLGRSSKIDCDADCVVDVEMEGHYTVTTDISSASLYVVNVVTGVFVEVIATGSMQSGEDVVFNYTPTTSDDFIFWLVDERSKTHPPTNADRDGLYNSWSLITEGCTVEQAYLTVSES